MRVLLGVEVTRRYPVIIVCDNPEQGKELFDPCHDLDDVIPNDVGGYTVVSSQELKDCPNCDGTGRIKMDTAYGTCQECKGKGDIPPK